MLGKRGSQRKLLFKTQKNFDEIQRRKIKKK